MKVYHCPVISKSLHQGKDGFYMYLRVVHVEHECEVQCLSGQKKVMKKISVVGRYTYSV